MNEMDLYYRALRDYRKAVISDKTHTRFMQAISKAPAREDKLEMIRTKCNIDEEWVDSQVVCQYLRICEKTLQRLRSAGKISYSCVGNKYYYQIAEIKRCLKAHLIKSGEEMLDDLMQNGVYTPRKRRV
jgi:hypothetical protein